MKILIYIHSLSSGGAERVTTNLANYWSSLGFELTIVTASSIDEDFYELRPDTFRVSLGSTSISKNYISGLMWNVKRVFKLRSIIKSVNPDISIGMMTTANCLLSISAIGLSTKTIGAVRVYPPRHKINSMWMILRNILYRYLDVIVVQTQTTADWFQKNVKVNNVEVIANPIICLDSTCKNKDSTQDISCTANIVLAVGRLEEQKGF